MTVHPEERRVARLLRDLIVRQGTTPEDLEKRLSWEAGRLRALLAGRQRLSFDEVLEILPLLETTPTDFFAWLYGAPGKEPTPSAMDEARRQRAMERLFERSLRAVRTAIARRSDWKRQRTDGT